MSNKISKIIVALKQKIRKFFAKHEKHKISTAIVMIALTS